MARVGAAWPQPARTCLCPACSVGASWETRRHGIRAHRDRDPRRRADRRGRPCWSAGDGGPPAWTTTRAAGTTLTRPRPPEPPGRGRRRRRSSQPDAVAPEAPPDGRAAAGRARAGAGLRDPAAVGRPAGAAALAAGPLAVLPRPRPAHRPGPREADRGRLGGGRGDASWPPTSASPRPPRSWSGCAPSRWCWPPRRAPTCASCWSRELTAVLGPDLDRTLGTDRHDGHARRRPRRRRQRRGQDDDGRQDRPRAGRRRQERRPRCRRHLPRRGRRPARDLGRAGRRPHRARPRGRRPGVGGVRGGPHRHRGARSTPS